jgi:hypothetical protein
MMGERLVMQESLSYWFRLEDHVPCNHLPGRIDFRRLWAVDLRLRLINLAWIWTGLSLAGR